MSNYQVIQEDRQACILYVPGNNGNVDMGDILLYNGGYICPKHNDLSQYISLHSVTVENEDGDIIFILTDGLLSAHKLSEYMETVHNYIEGVKGMNNWGPRPMIEVIAGDIPNQYLTNIVTDQILCDAIVIEPKVIMVQDSQYVVTDVADSIDIDSEEVKIAIQALHDHINNTVLADWATQEADYGIDTGEGETLWADEWNGTYNGPSMRIKTIYFTVS